jgi:hypothetical protein
MSEITINVGNLRRDPRTGHVLVDVTGRDESGTLYSEDACSTRLGADGRVEPDIAGIDTSSKPLPPDYMDVVFRKVTLFANANENRIRELLCQ